MGEGYLEVKKPEMRSQIFFNDYQEFEKAMNTIRPKMKYLWKEGKMITTPPKCPTCESKTRYIKQNGEWYCDYCEESLPREVGKNIKRGGRTTHVGFIFDSVMHIFTIPRFFPSLNDYLKSEKEGFVEYNYSQWKEIKGLGYRTCKEFDKARGNYALEKWKQIKELGYQTFTDYDDVRGRYELNDWMRIINMGYTNAKVFNKDRGDFSLDVWENLKSFGFEDSKEFKEAKEMGFVGVQYSENGKEYFFNNKNDYENRYDYYFNSQKKDWLKDIDYVELEQFHAAKKGKFKNRDEFSKAIEKGFDSVKEWSEFKESKFSNRNEFLQARKLGIANADTKKVYDFLVSFEQGIPVAISSIIDNTKIKKKKLSIICRQKPISDLGSYIDEAGNFIRGGKIKRNNLPYKHAILDGSNVAHGNGDDKPKLTNILNMKKKLEEMGLKVIVLISASLRHKIDNPEGLEEKLKKKLIIQNPSERDNDIFILQAALDKNAFIVSNDNFREWKEANPEQTEEIEQRSVKFSFIDEQTIHFDDKLSTLIRSQKDK